jgi:hypothetical protein
MRVRTEFSNCSRNRNWRCVPAFVFGLCIAFSVRANPVADSRDLAGSTSVALPLTTEDGDDVGYTAPLHWLSVTASTPALGRPIPGNWFDRAHGGHGFDFQLFALDPTNGRDVYFLTFYTYKTDGTSEWYQAVGSLVDGVFVASPQANGSSLYRIIYTTSATSITGLALDNSVSGSISVDFNQASQSPACLSKDRSNALQLAVMSWHIGGDSGQWCVEPIVAPTAHPSLDFNGHWFASSDSGWGMEILDVSTGTGSAPTIVIYIYYPGPNDQPTWATASGSLNNGVANMQLLQVSDGYCRTCTPPSQLTANNIGTISLTFNQGKAGSVVPTGSATIQANYPGGGGFSRQHISTQMLSMPFVSTGPLVIQQVAGSGQQGVAFTLPAPVVSGGAQPYHFRFDTFFNGSPPAGSIIDLFTGVVSIPKLNVAGFYEFYICVDDIGGESKCSKATATILSPANAVLKWSVGDQCNNGAKMYYRFFDRSANLVWPPSPNAFVMNYGQSFQNALNCTSGHQICLGAESGAYSWGVGLDDAGSCTASATCGQGPYSNNLTCGGSGGSSYYANWSCGSSSQCASVMGAYVGTEGPFCSSSSCQAWGNAYIIGGYACSTTPTYTPTPGGSQCYNYP